MFRNKKEESMVSWKPREECCMSPMLSSKLGGNRSLIIVSASFLFQLTDGYRCLLGVGKCSVSI